MPNNPLRDILNNIKWNANMSETAHILFIDKQQPDDVKQIPSSHVQSINPKDIGILGDENIPYHRILQITQSGKKLYENKHAYERLEK